MKDHRPFGFAGLWERCGELRCTTGCPSFLVRSITTTGLILKSRTRLSCNRLYPYPADEMAADPVSTHVNNARNIDEKCIEPLVQKCFDRSLHGIPSADFKGHTSMEPHHNWLSTFVVYKTPKRQQADTSA